MTDNMDFFQLIEFAKWKQANPDKYKAVMADVKEIIKDVSVIMEEISEGL